MIGLIPKLNIYYSVCDAFISFLSVFRKKEKIDESILYVNHARTGLRIALTSFRLKENAKVGVLAFNCYSVMNAVKSAGYDIVFIDVNDDFRIDIDDLKSKKSSFSVLIVTHLFGYVNDMAVIKSICPAIPIIEDCAHAYLSNSKDGLAGSFGDVSVFSIGQGKFPSIGDGGYIIINNKSYLMHILSSYNSLKFNSLYQEIVNILKNLLLSTLHIRIIYKYFTKPILKERHRKNSDAIKFENTENQILKSNYYLYKFKSKYFNHYLDIQKHHSKVILSSLMNSGKKHDVKFIEDTDYSNGFMFPVLTSEQKKSDIIQAFKMQGIEVAPHFAQSIEWASMFGYQVGNCPKVEAMLKRIIVIPSHYNLKIRDIEKIQDVISTL